MKRFQPGLIRMVPTCMVLFGIGLWARADDAAKPKTHEVRLNGHVFTLPVGFEIELAAGPPLVDLIGTLVLLIATTGLALHMAGRIFRIGILRTGQPPKIIEMLRWATRRRD